MLPRCKTQKKKVFDTLVKSVKRTFDFPCSPCDKISAQRARQALQKKVAEPCEFPRADWCYDPLWLLKQRVRELVSGWGALLVSSRKAVGEMRVENESWVKSGYVPDQQGCLETERGRGGTLGTGPSECTYPDSTVRVGVAKTKGKFRVVTMQSARVKRILAPVHTALYDHISSFDWCVRGDVSREDFMKIFDDRRDGEEVISGDYVSATDNIYLESVWAIVEVLAEDPDLSEEERKVLLGSFSGLEWLWGSKELHPIRRGSMMGNLVSFPLLCILNKSCFDICSDIARGSGSQRRSRINGDDCLFAGNREFYALWRKVTASYGLVVNEEKTGISDGWADLNSQPFLVSKGLMPRPCLSFLRPRRLEPDCLLREVWMGIRCLSAPTRAWVFNVAMRQEIAIRDICVSDVPQRVLDGLLRKSWFRRALEVGPAPLISDGVKRTVPVVLSNPPVSRAYRFVTEASNRIQQECVAFWQGRKVVPFSEKINKPAYYQMLRDVPNLPTLWHKARSEPVWKFLWPRELLCFFERSFPHLLLSDEECLAEWIDDHPFLKVDVSLINHRPRPCAAPLLRAFMPRLWDLVPLLSVDGEVLLVSQ